MFKKLISCLKFKEKVQPDISFLDFKSDCEREQYDAISFVSTILNSLDIEVEEFNKGVMLLNELQRISKDRRIKDLYDSLEPKSIISKVQYLKDPMNKGVNIGVPTVQCTGKGSYCTMMLDKSKRKRDNSHRKVYLDLETIALYSKVIQGRSSDVKLENIDQYFYVTLRAIYIHEYTHKFQIHLEEALDEAKFCHMRRRILLRSEAIYLFSEHYAYEHSAWEAAIRDRKNLDYGDGDYEEAVRNLSILLMTKNVVIFIKQLYKEKKLRLYGIFTYDVE